MLFGVTACVGCVLSAWRLRFLPLHVSGVTRPSSGGSAQMLFGVTTCAACTQSAHILRT
jgi:hypothetical protein